MMAASIASTAANSILSHIVRKGWQTEPVGAGWRISRGELALYLSFTPSWVCLQAPLGAPLRLSLSRTPSKTQDDTDNERHMRLLRSLLRWNEVAFLAKFGLDAQGTPLLLAEFPLVGGLRLVEHTLEALERCWTQCELAGDGTTDAVVENLPEPPTPERAGKDRYYEESPGIPHEVLAYYLRAVEAKGWGARSKPKGITWLIGYKGQRLFEAYLTVTQSWTYFHIPVLTEVPALAGDPAVRRAFLAYLLGVNDAWYMAKLGLDAQERVVMMLEVPTQELEFDTFRLLTGLLGKYLDLYAREIQIMSNLPADQRLMDMLIG